MSKEIITGTLRKQLGFDGVVMTDDMTMKAITNHYAIGQATVDSIKAGSDIILIAHEYANITANRSGEGSRQQWGNNRGTHQ